MPGIKEVIISITNRCNLKCRMCDIPLCSLEELGTDLWRKILRNISQTGAQTIVFSGGEPLLRQDIFALIAEAKNNKMNACVTSNGYLLDDDCAQKLARAKVDVVNISIEGKPKTHDFLRGQGSYARAISALKNLKKYHIEATIATTVSRHNLEELTFGIHLAKELGATTVRFQPFSRIFLKENADKARNFFISKEEAGKLRRNIEAAIKASSQYGISINPANYLRRIPDYLNRDEKFSHGGCGALWTSCPVNAKGDIFPCWIFAKDDFIIGNLQEAAFFDIWGSPRHEELRGSIIKKGCSGCMLSCYDGNFGKNFVFTEFFKKGLKLFRKGAKDKLVNKTVQAIRMWLRLYKYRYVFYKAYRGKISNVTRRVLKKIFTLNGNGRGWQTTEAEKSLRDLSEAKKRIQEKMANMK